MEAKTGDLKHRLQLRGDEVAHELLILPSNAMGQWLRSENQCGDVQDDEKTNAGETEDLVTGKEEIDKSSGNGETDVVM